MLCPIGQSNEKPPLQALAKWWEYVTQHHFEKEECLPRAYFMCDCNDLKQINDHYGHEMGDQYIQVVSDVLRFVAFGKGACIRWGGDEFLVITPNCEKSVHESLMEAIQNSRQELSAVNPAMGLSMGGILRETMEIPEPAVMKAADERMYADKAASKHQATGTQISK